MSVVELADVQQWLEETKLSLSNLDPSLTATATAVAFGIVSESYDTTTWVDSTTTPAVVRVAISYLIAAWVVNRAYSENAGPSDYGLYLEGKGMDMLEGIKSGTIDILEVPGTIESGFLSFYPDDTTGFTETYDGQGNLVGVAGGEDIKFFMGKRF